MGIYYHHMGIYCVAYIPSDRIIGIIFIGVIQHHSVNDLGTIKFKYSIVYDIVLYIYIYIYIYYILHMY